jgi:uncharacterized protein YbcI
MTSPSETLKGGALNAAISNAVVGLLSQNVGKGPTKARTIHSGKIVLCVLEDTMTKAERNLATHGKEDFVLGMRHAFQETMREELTDTVEALTGRKVVAFMSANHVDPDLAAEVFVLDEPVAGTAKEVGSDSFSYERPSGNSASHDGERPTVNSASHDGQRISEDGIGTTARSDAQPAEVKHDAERWLDDGGSFSSQTVARSKTPST